MVVDRAGVGIIKLLFWTPARGQPGGLQHSYSAGSVLMPQLWAVSPNELYIQAEPSSPRPLTDLSRMTCQGHPVSLFQSQAWNPELLTQCSFSGCYNRDPKTKSAHRGARQVAEQDEGPRGGTVTGGECVCAPERGGCEIN